MPDQLAVESVIAIAWNTQQPSKLEYIAAGLADLVTTTKRLGISSLALPALGCGLGGLKWTDVRPLIEAAFDQQPAVRIVLFGPQ